MFVKVEKKDGSILISVMLSSQMIIAGVRHGPYSSQTPSPPHDPTHKDSDSLFFTSNAFITEIRLLTKRTGKRGEKSRRLSILSKKIDSPRGWIK